ncbi:hypothetical protein [Pseudobacillus wudalianchiensis]|uniref:Uncharacterized protein n=1 Tax=Pseudobacillus wudalianchiensis TaxID=1743143 RepID=A0A1B9B888_9BACI|nr:hypothetical protein [Bacillus wudalianchiensis]OCA92305.1 hypothetical protein A8F95_00840 [Bacillus wudalianchiensis]
MQVHSLSSVIFSFIGVMFVGLSFVLSNFVEYLLAVGFIFLLIGAYVSFRAIVYREAGKMKFIGLVVFFSVLLVIVLVVPFHIVRLFTWVKNWSIIEELLLRMRQS